MSLPLVVAACGQSTSPSAGAPSAAGAAHPASAASAAPSARAADSVVAKPSGAARLQYPTYVPITAAKADLPGTKEGVADAYFSFPTNLIKSVATPPGKGGDVSVIETHSGRQLPKPVDQNPTWQRLNKELNANMKPIISTNSNDGAVRLATMMAGGDLPDLINIGAGGNSNLDLGAFLAHSCADLTPYVGGDAVKDYPNLANLPPYAWRGSRVAFGGKIFCVPNTISPAGTSFAAHQDLLDQAGVGPINSAADLMKAMVAVNRPEQGRYALGDYAGLGYTRQLAAQIFGAPNNWRLDASGKLVKDIETDEYKASLGFLRDVWAQKLYHPDSLTMNSTSAPDAMATKKVVFENFASFSWKAVQLDPKAQPVIVAPFSADGKAKPQYFLGGGTFSNVAIKAAPAERVKELLGILNYLAAPFGSQEQLLINYGMEGTDFTFDGDGNPNPMPNGYFNAWVLKPLGGPPFEFQTPDPVRYAKTIYAGEQAEIAAGVADPTISLNSLTDSSQGNVLRQLIQDSAVAIITGRDSISTWDQTVTGWRTKAGDKVRAEYQDALASSAA